MDTPKSVATVAMAVTGAIGAIGVIGFAVTTLSSTILNIIGVIKIAASAFALSNLPLTTLILSVGYLTKKLIEFSGEVGGISNAWAITITQMQVGFWDFVSNVLRGLNQITQYIPILGSAVSNMLEASNVKLSEAETRLDNLIETSIKPITIEAGKIEESVPRAFSAIAQSSKKSEEELKKFKSELESISKEADNLKEKMVDLFEDQIKSAGGLSQNYAEAFVKQEEKVVGIKSDIESKKADLEELRLDRVNNSNFKSVIERRELLNSELKTLEEKLNKEENALKRHQTISMQLSDEVADVRRFNAMTDFEQEVELLYQKGQEQTKQFSKRMTELQKEVDETNKRTASLMASEAQITGIVQAESAKRVQEAEKASSKIVTVYESMASSAKNAIQSIPSLNFGFGGGDDILKDSGNPFQSSNSLFNFRNQSTPMTKGVPESKPNQFIFDFRGSNIVNENELMSKIKHSINQDFRYEALGI